MDNLKDQPLPPFSEARLQLLADNVYKEQKTKNIRGVTTRKDEISSISALLMTLALTGLLMITISRSTLQTADGEISRLLSSREKSNTQVQGFQKNLHLLHRELSILDDMIQQSKENGNNIIKNDLLSNTQTSTLDEVNVMKQRVEALTSSTETLQAHVQEVSRREAKQKYGLGVHRVKIQLEFPDKTDGPDILVIELAPVDLMPHSVNFFLDMVSTGLLEGCSFVTNIFHVLKASTLPYDGSSTVEKARAFTNRGLESVAFREYSESYPHKRHTVGLAADGSPSFYINTEDNTDIHVGVPCIGKIIAGFDTIERLEQIPIRNHIWFEERIGIKSATMLPLVLS